jgi:hypothetical protein
MAPHLALSSGEDRSDEDVGQRRSGELEAGGDDAGELSYAFLASE